MPIDAREQFRRAYSIARRAKRKTGEQRDRMWSSLHDLPDPVFAVINEAVHRRHCADPLRCRNEFIRETVAFYALATVLAIATVVFAYLAIEGTP